MRTIYNATNRQKVIPRLDRGIQKTLDCPVEPDNDRSLMAYSLYRKQGGFTLVELMITMVVFVLAMVAAANIFSGILTQFKQQSSIAESNIEGIGGLELMRHDVEQAGFGLPWNLNSATYAEADTSAKYDPNNTDATIKNVVASSYNDASSNIPRAVVVGNNVLMNGSDVLAIKATNVATNAASQKWEYIVNNGNLPNMLRDWGGITNPNELLAGTDHVIILNPAAGVNNRRVLMNSGGFDVRLDNNSFSFVNNSTTTVYSPFEPVKDSFTAYLAYGVAPGALRMPLNRADFYIKRPANAADFPTRCARGTGGAAGTGILYKATVNHNDGGLTELPLLDCVLDMQVVFAVDTAGGGSATDWLTELPSTEYTAQVIRDRLKEIRIYLIVQEGQKDISYTSPSTITISDPNLGTIKTDDLNALVGVDYKYYRWKLHTMVMTPYNLR